MKHDSVFGTAIGFGTLLCAITFAYTYGISPLTSFSPAPPSRDEILLSVEAVMGEALEAFRRDVGRYPSSEEGLAALLRDPQVPGWSGSYLPWTVIPRDPWGQPFDYSGQPGAYRLLSPGPQSAKPEGKPGEEKVPF